MVEPRRDAAPSDGPDFLHIGYHRTASTFLQRVVFSALKDHLQRASPSGWRLLSRQEEPSATEVRDFYAAQRAQVPSGRLILESNESFSGTLFKDELVGVEQLQRLNPRLRVIVVLRSQLEILPSLYHLHVKMDGTESYARFLERALANGKCDYLAMVERLHARFGPERVCIALYEDLRSAPDRFFEQICRFLDVPVPPLTLSQKTLNQRQGLAVLRTRRFANAALGALPPAWKLRLREPAAAFAGKLGGLAGGLGVGRSGSLAEPQLEARIRARFAADNRELSILLDRSLEDLGYPV